MYLILVYDIHAKRVAKVLKICRCYLNHIQNSVFEGSLTQSAFSRLEAELMNIIDPEYDSIIIFKTRGETMFNKAVLGIQKSKTEVFL